MNKSVVIKYFDGVCKVANALELRHSSVSQWPELIPKGAALELEKITNGALKCDLSLYKGRRRKTVRTNTPTNPKGE